MAATHPGGNYRIANVASTTYAQRAVYRASAVDWWLGAFGTNLLLDDGGEEELRNGDTAASIIVTKTAYTAGRRAAGADRVIGLTIPPASLAWYTANSNNVDRVAVNAAMVNTPGALGYDQVVDIASLPELADPSNVTYFSDGIHYTAAGAAVVAAALQAAGV